MWVYKTGRVIKAETHVKSSYILKLPICVTCVILEHKIALAFAINKYHKHIFQGISIRT